MENPSQAAHSSNFTLTSENPNTFTFKSKQGEFYNVLRRPLKKKKNKKTPRILFIQRSVLLQQNVLTSQSADLGLATVQFPAGDEDG